MDVEPTHDTLPVSLYSADADAELIGDFFVAATLSDEDQNLPFSGGELSEGFSFAPVLHQVRESSLGNLRTKEGFALIDDFNSSKKVLRGCFL